MSKTIEGVPEYLTREQYLSILSAVGFEPGLIREIRYASDGVHALVFEVDEKGERRVDLKNGGYYKHRVFIPIRDSGADERTTRFSKVAEGHTLLTDPNNSRVA